VELDHEAERRHVDFGGLRPLLDDFRGAMFAQHVSARLPSRAVLISNITPASLNDAGRYDPTFILAEPFCFSNGPIGEAPLHDHN
jgi:hypothetical protein